MDRRQVLGTLAAAAFASLTLASPVLAAGSMNGKDDAKVKCQGANSCAGKGECAAADGSHACKGMNSCKGKGWIYVGSVEECEKLHGTVVQDKK
jgi:hypothetical protein